MRTFLVALAVSALAGCSLYFDGEGERKGKLGGNLDAGSHDPCPDAPYDGGSWHPDGGGWEPDAGTKDAGSFAGSPDAGDGSDGGIPPWNPCHEWHPDGGSWQPDAADVDGGVAPDAP